MSATVLFETERLRLETWGDGAVAEVLDLHSHPEVQRYLDSGGRSYDRARAERRVAEWRMEFADTGLGKHRLVRRADGVFVGRAGFSLYDGVPEISYSLVHRHWGQGYASEIAAGLVRWVFAGRPIDHILGFAHVDNRASRRVLEKVGMVPTHVAPVGDMPHQFYRLNREAVSALPNSRARSAAQLTAEAS